MGGPVGQIWAIGCEEFGKEVGWKEVGWKEGWKEEEGGSGYFSCKGWASGSMNGGGGASG